MTELDVAERLARGEGSVPGQFGNSWLVPMRISGTGAAFRPDHDEICYRDPSLWLGSLMQRRCLSLPVVVGHPASGALDGDVFRDTVIGVTVFSFIRGDELWTIARLFDRDVAERICDPDDQLFSADTSPSVIFGIGETAKLELDDGTTLLVEGVPGHIDHLAVVPSGVWSRGGPATGIEKTASKELEDA